MKESMIIDEKILVKNYKCFDSSGSGFEKIWPINVIIGKNNSGKSSLIELIKFLTKTHQTFIDIGRDNTKAEVFISHKLTEEEILMSFKKGYSGGSLPSGKDHFEYGKAFINKIYTYQLNGTGKKDYVHLHEHFIPKAKELITRLVQYIQHPLYDKKFCNITAERDIIPEAEDASRKLKPNGSGATNLVQQILNKKDKDSTLIESKLLLELNKILSPDIKFSRLLVQNDDFNKWEIFFEDNFKKRVALSKMGSGVKTVLQVLLNLIVKPVIDKKKEDNYIFAFEELENNLHPSLQRRLYNYIKEYSEKHSSYFFITTHSNVVIDAFSTYKNAQMIHVVNDGEKSTTSTILSHNGTKNALDDLGIKASDLLQSNGIIWVEGPSDRNYLNKWIKILSPNLKEGLHYSIMFYGGRLLSNLTFKDNDFNTKFIQLLKINKNAFVIIDRDGKDIKAKLNNTKKRINKEIGYEHCWITKGREIENYLTKESITQWLLDEHKYKSNFTNDKYIKLENNILSSNSKIKLKYDLNKVNHSAKIKDYIDKNSLNVLDLRKKMNELIACIKKWNLIDIK